MLTISKSSLRVISLRSSCFLESNVLIESGNKLDFLAIKKNIKRTALHHATSKYLLKFKYGYISSKIVGETGSALRGIWCFSRAMPRYNNFNCNTFSLGNTTSNMECNVFTPDR